MSSKLLSIIVFLVIAFLSFVALQFCDNSPWPSGFGGSSTFLSSFSSPIKGLDPATSYYVHESSILDNIVEAPLDYDYLARPYRLIPRLLTQLPEPRYFDDEGKLLSGDPSPDMVKRVEYLLTLQPDLQYQPHPCFVLDEQGETLYAGKNPPPLPKKIASPMDFPLLDSRPLHPEDFKVALARLCDPRLASPVYANLSSFIAGMKECSQLIRLRVAELGEDSALVDYRQIPLAGLEIVNDREFKLILSRKYPQALYWLAMHFFAPMPWEALQFFHSSNVIDTGLSLKNWPLGSGPYLLEEMNANVRIRLRRNPNYRREYWSASPGKPLPLLEELVFQNEREAIPNWIKFNQGYYDTSGIPADMLEAATTFGGNGELTLSEEMQKRGISLHRSITPTVFYFGFNMLDPMVGADSEKTRFLRQAISIVLDYQEFIDIFLNGQGVPAQCVIPPGIAGACQANEFVSPWHEQLGKAERLPLQNAQELMRKAGYPNGIAPDGSPLTLHLDHANAGASAFKAQFQWLKNKFSLLGIQIEERPSDLNRWRNKLETGNWQLIFNKGWLADYPDPENFLFLFYSDNGTVRSHGRGANYVNYASPEFDRLFRQLETMPESETRQDLIAQACRVLQEDAPCCWGYHPAKVILTHQWLNHYQPHDMSYNTIKYLDIDAEMREQRQLTWNHPRRWPVHIALITCFSLGFIAFHWRNNPHSAANNDNTVRTSLKSTLSLQPSADSNLENKTL